MGIMSKINMLEYRCIKIVCAFPEGFLQQTLVDALSNNHNGLKKLILSSLLSGPCLALSCVSGMKAFCLLVCLQKKVEN